MKRIFLIILSLYLAILFCGCNNNNPKTESSRKEVTVNMPSDDTVGGYRTGNKPSSTTDKIDGNNVTVATSSNSSSTTQENSTTTQISYCANLKSKIFHKSSCGSVKQMKEENKFYTKDKLSLLAQGYTPCKSCKP